MIFREFGFDWQVREGQLVAGSPWEAGGVTRWTAPAYDHIPTRRRISLSAINASAGVSLVTPLGFGRITIYGEGCLDAIPIDAVAGAWLYDDRPGAGGGTEVDIECTRWGDPNNPNGIHIGVHHSQVTIPTPEERERRLELVRVPGLAFYHWRWVIETRPGVARCEVHGWQGSKWVIPYAYEFGAPKTERSTLRIACWRGPMLTTRGRVPAKFAMAGVKFA